MPTHFAKQVNDLPTFVADVKEPTFVCYHTNMTHEALAAAILEYSFEHVTARELPKTTNIPQEHFIAMWGAPVVMFGAYHMDCEMEFELTANHMECIVPKGQLREASPQFSENGKLVRREANGPCEYALKQLDRADKTPCAAFKRLCANVDATFSDESDDQYPEKATVQAGLVATPDMLGFDGIYPFFADIVPKLINNDERAVSFIQEILERGSTCMAVRNGIAKNYAKNAEVVSFNYTPSKEPPKGSALQICIGYGNTPIRETTAKFAQKSQCGLGISVRHWLAPDRSEQTSITIVYDQEHDKMNKMVFANTLAQSKPFSGGGSKALAGATLVGHLSLTDICKHIASINE